MESSNSPRPAIFFDRDGTLMVEVEYCSNPVDVAVFPGVPDALRKLREAGFLCVVITNQSGIGRGYYSEEDYNAVHAEFLRQIGPGLIDGTYFCPDVKASPTSRRKPSPAMVHEAERDLGIDLARSFFVGDKAIDVECGRNAGTRAILVATGYGSKQAAQCAPDFVAKGVEEAVEWILRQGKKP